jgi:hypothetical protein
VIGTRFAQVFIACPGPGACSQRLSLFRPVTAPAQLRAVARTFSENGEPTQASGNTAITVQRLALGVARRNRLEAVINMHDITSTPPAKPDHIGFPKRSPTSNFPLHAAYSYRRISTGCMRAADRAGTIVDAALISNAAADIHSASAAFGWNGTYGTE